MAVEMPFVRIVLKFAEAQEAFLRHREFISPSGETFSALNEWLRRYPPSDIYSLFGLSSASGQEASATERTVGLDRFFCIVLETDVGEVESQLRELNGMPFLEEAYVERPTELAWE